MVSKWLEVWWTVEILTAYFTPPKARSMGMPTLYSSSSVSSRSLELAHARQWTNNLQYCPWVN